MEIRRTLLWMIFSLSLLLLWNNWQTYHGKPSLFSAPAPTQDQPQAHTEPPPASVPSATALPSGPVTTELPAVASSAPNSQQIHISTDVYNLTFDTQGAQLVHAELPRFSAVEDTDQPMVLLDNAPDTLYLVQSGVVGAPQGQSFPTHLSPYQFVSSATTMTGDTLDVVFAAHAGGLQVVKTYTFYRGRYDIDVRHTLTNHSHAPVTPSLYLQLTRNGNDLPDTSFFYKTFTGPVVYSEEERFQKVSFSDIEKNKASYARQADNGWIGMVQHYFATAWIPPQGTTRKNEILRLANNLYTVRSIESVGAIAPGAQTTVQSTLWLGPQDQQAMSAIAPGLELVVDYGWLTIIAKPLFTVMTWLHAMLGNWGWTIVLLTLLIKLAFYPLSAASYRSMAKMKHVTPRMQALREKYADDRAKLNQAMMEMYRTEKINPLGGCLPMLVQMPVFIALYWVLLGSVEMRGAPWLLWVQDLSVRDPWFILPAIMMATMFLQIKLNPTPPDPMQARIMMLMPLVFGGMMFFFPAGLVLYWCVNNAVSIAQQRYIMHKLDKTIAAATR